jgi:membrane fusion protein (multidrug efflux system)
MSEAPATAAEETDAADANTRQDRQQARRLWLTRLALAVAAVAVLWGFYYFLFGRNHTSTDDAYVAAEVAQVTPLSDGTVLKVNVSDTDAVKAGQILVELDPATAKINLAAAEAELAAARRRFRQAVATSSAAAAQASASGQGIAEAEAALVATRANAARAHAELARRESVAAAGGVSGEELGAARTSAAGADAAVRQAEASVASARQNSAAAKGQSEASAALVRGSSEETDPAVLAAKARLDAARIEFGHMVIRAPIDGVITRRQVQIGQHVAQGNTLMTIVPVGQVYVDANFKERQLRRVEIGMPAEVTADIYGGSIVYHGRVAGIGGGTGASQALIPAQNATGNWIKIVQRLPVRIALDPKELAAHPLRVGLSTEVTIDLSGN